MGNFICCRSAKSPFVGVPALKNVRGPNRQGSYYIVDRSDMKVEIRFRLRDKYRYWEWKIKGQWENIPHDLTVFGLLPSTIDALVHLRDFRPEIDFGKHVTHVKPLGGGYNGDVYKVQFGLIMGHEFFVPVHTPLAMKTLKKEQIGYGDRAVAKNALENEMDTLNSVRSNYVLRFYQRISYEGEIAMVTELCTGGTADDLRKRTQGMLPEVIILTMISHCTQALRALHAKNIVHRDIKPDNIFISSDPEGNLIFKLGDFGLAKASVEPTDLLSNHGFLDYRAPEVYQALSLPSPPPAMSQKSDVWALGLSVYFMCTNKLPFTDNDKHRFYLSNVPIEPIRNVLGGEGYHYDVQTFLDMCLNKNPDLRATADDLCNKFAHLSKPTVKRVYY